MLGRNSPLHFFKIEGPQFLRNGRSTGVVEHFAHLRRRTLRNRRDKVIIETGSAD